MGFCFSFGPFAIVFCKSFLGVTDCVRPGVATFSYVIINISQYARGAGGCSLGRLTSFASLPVGRGRTNLHRLTFQKENTTTWLSSDVLHRLLWYIYASDTAGMSACNHRMHAKNMSIWVSLDMWHKRADSSPQAIRCVKINKIKILAMTHEVL